MKIVVVGGVAAGMSVAARARRLDEFAEIVVLERGHHVSFANCGLPYHIGEGGEARTGGVKHAVVIGAGYIGLEMAENLHERGVSVEIVEMADQIMAPLDRELTTTFENTCGRTTSRCTCVRPPLPSPNVPTAGSGSS